MAKAKAAIASSPPLLPGRNPVLASYPDTYLECRHGARHRWDQTPHPNDLPWPSYGFPRTYRCERCGTRKVQVINRMMRVDGCTYYYPIGYSFVRDERPDREVLVAEALARDTFLIQAEQERLGRGNGRGKGK